MTVGEVSQRSGLPVSTIHFYESKGLIQSERTSGNQRRYSPAILRYLAIVKVAQRAGLSLDEVLDALGQYQPGDTIDLTVMRSGKTMNIKATLAAYQE